MSNEETNKLKLTGTVELDEESIDRLTSKIREEILEKMIKNGPNANEIVRILKGYFDKDPNCVIGTYYLIILETINDAVSVYENQIDNIAFPDTQRYNKLCAIRNIMKI